MIPILSRLILDVDGERVVIAPWTVDDLEAAQASAMAALDAFARHIEEPADALDRGMLWIGHASVVWQDTVDALIARMRMPNRAARRRMN
jgi:ribulose-5-phosphate 4-epimerase/fuculose-1-phosphate aldolase